MSVESASQRRIQRSFIEWDTVRGRGDFDAGYVNEFSLCMNENGEIDEQKRKQFEEDRQNRLIKSHKSCSSSHKRSGQKNLKIKATASEDNIVRKAKKTRVVKVPPQNQQSKICPIKSTNNLTDFQVSEQ